MAKKAAKKVAKKTTTKKVVSKKVTKKTVKTTTKKVESKKTTQKKPVTKKVTTQKSDSSKDIAIVTGIIALILGLIFLGLHVTKNSHKENNFLEPVENSTTVFVIEDPNCESCNVDLFLSEIKSNLISDLEVKKISSDDKFAKKLITSLNQKVLPIYLFESEIDQREDWEAGLSQGFIDVVIENKRYYQINPQFIPQKVLIDELEVNENMIVLGNKDAKVTLFEFSDFECPFCAISKGNTQVPLYQNLIANFPEYEAPMPKVFEEYIDTGLIRYVFVNMPLEEVHLNAKRAHVAALCANEQEVFKEFSDILFLQRDIWSSETQVNNNIFISLAQQVESLNLETFTACLNDNQYETQIENAAT